MNIQTIDIIAIIGAVTGLVGVTIYSFRKLAGINKQKFEQFKRATSLRNPSAHKSKPQPFYEMH